MFTVDMNINDKHVRITTLIIHIIIIIIIIIIVIITIIIIIIIIITIATSYEVNLGSVPFR